jgi:hypothetical protein
VNFEASSKTSAIAEKEMQKTEINKISNLNIGETFLDRCNDEKDR